jgi:hypothetical protein
MTFPELLTHPNIPKPLHGVTPRDILGRKWWDEQRQLAYARYNYHCWAYGVHKSQADYHKWLEGHENYEIDYERGIVTLKEIVALCHACHSFIHSGRLWVQYQRGEVSKAKIQHIYQRGFRLLKQHDLKPFWGTAFQWLLLTGRTEQEALKTVVEKGLVPKIARFAEWQEWRLVLAGKEYRSRFKDEEEWARYYARPQTK